MINIASLPRWVPLLLLIPVAIAMAVLFWPHGPKAALIASPGSTTTSSPDSTTTTSSSTTIPVAPTTATPLATPTATTPSTTAKAAGNVKMLPANIKVMALGDSITADAGWRQLLRQQLVARGGHSWSFVGGQNDGTPNGLNEGHSGWVNQQLAEKATGWVRAKDPDVVLLHSGTNDIWTGSSGADAAGELTSVIENIYAGKPDAHVIVAGIVPMFVDGVSGPLADYEKRIPVVVQGFANQGKSIQYVDMSRLLLSSDTRDGVHPNDSGKGKVASAWLKAINQYTAGR